MARKVNLVMEQGASFSNTIIALSNTGEVVDLTGFTANGQMRKHFTSNTAYTFTVVLGTIDGAQTLSMNAETNANIVGGRYVYDVEATDGNTVIRTVEGIVTVTPNVTR